MSWDNTLKTAAACIFSLITLFIIFKLQVYGEVVSKLKKAYGGVISKIGDPLLSETLIGPLHTPAAVEAFKKTVAEAVREGGTIEFGGKVSTLLQNNFENMVQRDVGILHTNSIQHD